MIEQLKGVNGQKYYTGTHTMVSRSMTVLGQVIALELWHEENELGNQGAYAPVASITSQAKGGFVFIQLGH